MKYDVVIVGAGPAGSTAANFLSKKGIKTLLIDKNTFPRDKPCGGGITNNALKKYKYIKEHGLINSYSYSGIFYSSSLKYKVEIQKNEPIIGMISRKKFDHGLVNIAIDSGANFLHGKKVIDIKILKDNAKIILDNGLTIDSQIVIGADGVWSTITKKMGLGQHNKIFGVSIFEEYPTSTKTIDKYFTDKRIVHGHIRILGLAGYGWVFPKKECINIGVVDYISSKSKLDDKKNLKNIYRKYIQILKESKIIPNDIKINKLRGAVLPYCPIKKTFTDRVIICGDAAGLINPLTGEGIDYAMYSGEIAADVISKSLENGNVSSQFLSKYEKKWKSDFGKNILLLSHASREWGKGEEHLIKLASEDKKMADIFFEIGVGNSSIKKYKWKLASRLIYLKFKNLFKN